MIQSHSLPDNLKSDSPLYDAIDTPSGSPYCRRYPTAHFQNNHNESKVNESSVIFTFESPNGSPYTRRVPANERKPRCVLYEIIFIKCFSILRLLSNVELFR